MSPARDVASSLCVSTASGAGVSEYPGTPSGDSATSPDVVKAFTVDEVAALYAISPTHVRQLVNSETLAKVPHLGRAVRISWDELERVFGPLPKDVAA